MFLISNIGFWKPFVKAFSCSYQIAKIALFYVKSMTLFIPVMPYFLHIIVVLQQVKDTADIFDIIL